MVRRSSTRSFTFMFSFCLLKLGGYLGSLVAISSPIPNGSHSRWLLSAHSTTVETKIWSLCRPRVENGLALGRTAAARCGIGRRERIDDEERSWSGGKPICRELSVWGGSPRAKKNSNIVVPLPSSAPQTQPSTRPPNPTRFTPNLPLHPPPTSSNPQTPSGLEPLRLATTHPI